MGACRSSCCLGFVLTSSARRRQKGGADELERLKRRKVHRGKVAKKLRQKHTNKAIDIKDNQAYVRQLRFLADIPLFMHLPKDLRPVLAAACEEETYAIGETVIAQGEDGVAFYIVSEGKADVYIQDSDALERLLIRTLEPGDHFGEQALFCNERRTASVIARTALSCYVLTRERFQQLHVDAQLCFARRRTVRGGRDRPVPRPPPTPATQEERELLCQAIRGNDNLKALLGPDANANELVDVMWRKVVPAGTTLIRAGDLQAHFFYIVQNGKFMVQPDMCDDGEGSRSFSSCAFTSLANGFPGRSFSSEAASELDYDLPQLLNFTKIEYEPWGTSTPLSRGNTVIQKGGSFGELALLHSSPRTATVVALEESTVWIIDRPNFKRILMHCEEGGFAQRLRGWLPCILLNSRLAGWCPFSACALRAGPWCWHEQTVALYAEALGQVDILAPLLKTELATLAETLEAKVYACGHDLVREGDSCSILYILLDGAVSVLVGTDEVEILHADPKTHIVHSFCERALLNDVTPLSTVRVFSEIATALVLDRTTLHKNLGPLERLKERTRRRGTTSARKQPLYRRDLRIISLLGSGAFGRVELVEHTASKHQFALKGLSKGIIVKRKLQDKVYTEKEVLLMTDSNFIIRVYECYSDDQNLYFLLELASGGELFAVYRRHGLHGSIEHARFYGAGVVFALEHLHDRRILYRDLKPENILLNSEGYPKLTDMGLARFCVGKTYSTCGTPEYFSPEMINSRGYSTTVDWWAFGVLIFELMSGRTPFAARSSLQIYRKISRCDISFPWNATDVFKDFIKAILCLDPRLRLPLRSGGVSNLKTHRWYGDFNWNQMWSLKLPPPYRPKSSHDIDKENFRCNPEAAPKPMPYVDDGSGWDQDFATMQK